MKKVMVVDDDALIRELLCEIVKGQNFVAIEASDGKECIELYQKHSTDLVVIDIMMPEMDGASAIKELRSLNDRIKIIAISAAKSRLDEAKEAGADLTLAKPFMNDQFITAIKALL